MRLLLAARGWTAVVVLSLALGIGANTALFSAVNGMLLTKVPVAAPDSLVRLRYDGRNDMVTSSSDYGFMNKTPDGQNMRSTFSYPMYQQFLADNRTMLDLLACAPLKGVNVVSDGQAELATAFISSGNYYRLLGIGATRRTHADSRRRSPRTDSAGRRHQLALLACTLLARTPRSSAGSQLPRKPWATIRSRSRSH